MAVDKQKLSVLGRIDWLIHQAFSNQESRLFSAVSNLVIVVIFFSIGSIVFESVESIHTKHAGFFKVSEYIAVSIFVVEYMGMVYVTRPIRKYTLGIWGIIDFLAIAPSLIGALDLRQLKVARILRVLRFLRLMRILKLAKKVSDNYEDIKGQKYGTLKMDLQIYFITMFSVLIISSTLIFYAEHGERGTLFTDIPNSLWWGIVTMTTVGYGDMSPVTVAGRIVAGITSLCGLCLFAMLMNVVGKALMQGLFGHEDDESAADGGDTVVQGQGLMSVSERMDELVSLREQELVTPEEFEAKRRELVEYI
jgi:voltage-gated potassium channel